MSDSDSVGFQVFSRIHQYNPKPGVCRAEWITPQNAKLLLGLALFLLAVGLHCWCCDWNPPRWDSSLESHDAVANRYDNQLIGPVHAGSPFRNLSSDGALYNLSAAAWCGLYFPILVLFVATMMIMSECVPEKYRKAIQQRMRPVLARSPWRLRLTFPVFAVILSLALGSTGAVGSVLASKAGTLTFVENTRDSYFAFRKADERPLTTSAFSYSKSKFSSSSSSSSSAQSVPEPGTIALLATAAASIAFYGWRRRRA